MFYLTLINALTYTKYIRMSSSPTFGPVGVLVDALEPVKELAQPKRGPQIRCTLEHLDDRRFGRCHHARVSGCHVALGLLVESVVLAQPVVGAVEDSHQPWDKLLQLLHVGEEAWGSGQGGRG